MDRRRLRLPRLNLADAHAARLTIAARYEWTDERAAMVQTQFESLSGAFGGESEGSMGFIGYTPRGESERRHAILILLYRFPASSPDIDLQIEYRPLAEPPGEGKGREDELLRLANSLGEASSLTASVEYTFDNKTADQLWFPLPVQLEGRSARDLFELQGVRGAKVDEETRLPEYTFTIDRSGGDDVLVNIRFADLASLNAELPRQVFRRAERIVPRLVER